MKIKHIVSGIVLVVLGVLAGIFISSFFNGDEHTSEMYNKVEEISENNNYQEIFGKNNDEENNSESSNEESEKADSVDESEDTLSETESSSVKETSSLNSESEPVSTDIYLEDKEGLGDPVNLDELNFSIKREFEEAIEYESLAYDGYGWIQYTDGLYVDETGTLIIQATPVFEDIFDDMQVMAVNEMQKVADVEYFVLSDGVYGDMPVTVYGSQGNIIADSTYDAPREIQLY